MSGQARSDGMRNGAEGGNPARPEMVPVWLGCALLIFLGLGFAATAEAAAISSAATGNWEAGATWVGGVVPVAADDVTIAVGHTVTITGGLGQISINSLTVNGTLTHTANTTTEAYKINLSVAVDCNVASGGAINADGKAQSGNGAPGNGAGFLHTVGSSNGTAVVTLGSIRGLPDGIA